MGYPELKALGEKKELKANQVQLEREVEKVIVEKKATREFQVWTLHVP